MSLHAAIESELPHLRAEANARMTSTCTVKERRRGPVNSSGSAFTYAAIHADLPCRVSSSAGAGQSRTTRVGDVEIQVGLRVLSFPWDTTGLRDGMYVLIESGESAGLFLRLVESDPADQKTARRISAVSDTKPSEWDA